MSAAHAPPSAVAWCLRFGLTFALLNTLLTFENRWPGFGVLYMPRLSFELCLMVVALMAWVGWRGDISRRSAGALAVAFLDLGSYDEGSRADVAMLLAGLALLMLALGRALPWLMLRFLPPRR